MICLIRNLKKLTSLKQNYVFTAADVLIEAADRTCWTAEKMSLNTVIRFWTLKNCCKVAAEVSWITN